MYLTAHRVKSSSGSLGTQAFLHMHDSPEEWPSSPWDVPRTHPGRLVAQQTPVRPGGNAVLSYLDIIRANMPDARQLQAILSDCENSIAAGTEPIRWVRGELHIEFSHVLAIRTAPERRSEFRCLAEATVALLAGFEKRARGSPGRQAA